MIWLPFTKKRVDKKVNWLKANVSSSMLAFGIAKALKEKSPFLVSRLGWFEGYSIGFVDNHGKLSQELREKLWNTPGIFPPTDDQHQTFSSEYKASLKIVDVLGLMDFPYESSVILEHAPQSLLCDLKDLEPYYHSNPWSQYLRGLNVLVIHPFIDSIKKQYKTHREKIFIDKNILPEFNLLTLMPPQTLCGNTDGYESWKDALDNTRKRILELDYDVAIVGCGAYGLPLGAYIKQQGKVCIHLGGATQTLFGIAGGRWIDKTPMSLYINSYWTRPDDKERPNNWKEAENGCYW
jgi:hypothetical protein